MGMSGVGVGVGVVPVKAILQRNMDIVRNKQTCESSRAHSKKAVLDALVLLDIHYNQKVERMIRIRENKDKCENKD